MQELSVNSLIKILDHLKGKDEDIDELKEVLESLIAEINAKVFEGYPDDIEVLNSKVLIYKELSQDLKLELELIDTDTIEGQIAFVLANYNAVNKALDSTVF